MANCFFARKGFPQIYSLSSSDSEVEGFITALNEEFYIHLSVVQKTHPKEIRLRGSWKLQRLLQPVRLLLEQHLSLCGGISEMLQELKNVLEQQMRSQEKSSVVSLPTVHYYDILLKELQDVGWNTVYYISSSLDHVKLRAFDECSRQHILDIRLPEQFPNEAPTCTCDFPEEFTFKWSSDKTLLNLYNHFKLYLARYFDFWNWMDEIDENTWVLEPENPSRSSCKRRIAVAATASLLIIVNPASPSAIPTCYYFGPEKVIEPLREKFSKNIDLWDESMSLLFNLRNVLDMEFPSPLTSSKEEFCVDCGICYTYKLGDSLPDIMCNDTKCNRPFHHNCLYEWLKSIPSTKQTLDVVFGECPYCSKTIWCSLPRS